MNQWIQLYNTKFGTLDPPLTAPSEFASFMKYVHMHRYNKPNIGDLMDEYLYNLSWFMPLSECARLQQKETLVFFTKYKNQHKQLLEEIACQALL